MSSPNLWKLLFSTDLQSRNGGTSIQDNTFNINGANKDGNQLATEIMRGIRTQFGFSF